MSYIVQKRHVWRVPWENPRVNMTLQPGTTATLHNRPANPSRIGFLTDIGCLWVPGTSNPNSFYYNWIMDGELQEQVLRVIGGSNTNATPPTGVSNPVQLNPPVGLRFIHNFKIIAVNNDTIPHVAEWYANGYDVFRRPDDPSYGER